MSKTEIIALAGLLAISLQPAIARDNEDEAKVREEAEREPQAATEEVRRAALEIERAIDQGATDRERVVGDIEIEMREAESRLAEAARRVAELSSRRLPGTTWTTAFSGKPVLGVTIGARDEGEPVAGVEIIGVSPGGAADEAGIRAGDVITSINDESLGAESGREANRKLLDFMAGVEAGDVLEIEYLRGGKSGIVSLQPRPANRVFSFNGNDFSLRAPPLAPAAPGAAFNRYVFVADGAGLGDMEMVSLTEGLGRYFGTDEGLLVVRAPKDAETYKLDDGDVILDIDGREPRSVSHAVRILASYQAGEVLEIHIMRDKRERTLEIEVPDRRTGASRVPAAPAPAPAPGPEPAVDGV